MFVSPQSLHVGPLTLSLCDGVKVSSLEGTLACLRGGHDARSDASSWLRRGSPGGEGGQGPDQAGGLRSGLGRAHRFWVTWTLSTHNLGGPSENPPAQHSQCTGPARQRYLLSLNARTPGPGLSLPSSLSRCGHPSSLPHPVSPTPCFLRSLVPLVAINEGPVTSLASSGC